ncbi:MAG: hypothetical protein IKN43_01735 [Selenomonadaceae bacterium]|nr:hypothetical protein [Selenomonadaceae bacterium]
MSFFDENTGMYFRSGIIKNGKDTGEYPCRFYSNFWMFDHYLYDEEKMLNYGILMVVVNIFIPYPFHLCS